MACCEIYFLIFSETIRTILKIFLQNEGRLVRGYFKKNTVLECLANIFGSVASATSTKHILKQDKISFAKDFISVHMQTLTLKCSQEI